MYEKKRQWGWTTFETSEETNTVEKKGKSDQ